MRVSVCVLPAAARWGEACETPKRFTVVRLPSETEKGVLACQMHLGIRSSGPGLAGVWSRDGSCGGAYVTVALEILGRKKGERHWRHLMHLESGLGVVWNLSGATLTVEYFKL